jgi:hypothetical protein
MKSLLLQLDDLILVQHGLECLKMDPLFDECRSTEPTQDAPLPWLTHVHPDDRARVLQALEQTRPAPRGPLEMTVRLIGPAPNPHSLGTAQLGVFTVSGQALILMSGQMAQNQSAAPKSPINDTI